MKQEDRDIQRKLRVLEPAERLGSVVKTCRYYGIARSTFYRWRVAYLSKGP